MHWTERLFMGVVAIGFIISAQMLIDIPNYDFPDIKDIPALFPNLNP